MLSIPVLSLVFSCSCLKDLFSITYSWSWGTTSGWRIMSWMLKLLSLAVAWQRWASSQKTPSLYSVRPVLNGWSQLSPASDAISHVRSKCLVNIAKNKADWCHDLKRADSPVIDSLGHSDSLCVIYVRIFDILVILNHKIITVVTFYATLGEDAVAFGLNECGVTHLVTSMELLETRLKVNYSLYSLDAQKFNTYVACRILVHISSGHCRVNDRAFFYI